MSYVLLQGISKEIYNYLSSDLILAFEKPMLPDHVSRNLRYGFYNMKHVRYNMKKYIPTHDACDVAIKHIRHIKHISLKPFENKNPTNYSRQYKN